MGMSARIHLCGAVSVEIAGRRVEDRLPHRQGVLLLAYLVLNRRRPVERDALVEAIWPEGGPAAAGPALRALLSKLRSAIGPELLPGRERVQLALPAGAWVDVEAAEEAIHRAETAVASGTWGAAWGAARVAAMIPERGLLGGHDRPWIDERRRELDRVVERAEACVVACGQALGGRELAAAERAARRLVERRPLDESAVMRLMEVLEAAGDPAGALQAFEDLRQRLRLELGTAPGPPLRALHLRLLGSG
jgi:SARP family transcriptional regulator, regulator of embCAB operon